jgi:Flp pilus assembly secretin CpaC
MMRRVGYLITALTAAALPLPAQAEDLIVKYDQSQILRLTRPASEIIIGNPSIADVTIQSGNILVVTGKSYGITNIIALDGERNVIQDQRIAVRRDEVGVVNLMRGTARQTYACLPQCNPTITLGDDVSFIAQTINSARDKISFSEGHSNEKGTPNQNN